MLEERRPQAGAARVLPGTAAPAGAAAATQVSAYRDPGTWAIVVAVFGAYLALSLFRLLQLTPSSWDLGIYTQYVKQYAALHAPIVDVRGAGFNLLGDHFQVIVALIAPFFRVFPSPATLLIAQALLTAVSVFPVTAAGTALLGRGAGRAIGAAYGFSWGLQQMIVFDFHEIAFAVPLLAFSLSALVRGRTRAAIAWALPLVFVKEDQGYTVAAIGLLILAAGAFPNVRPLRLIRCSIPGGAFLVWWGVVWSLLAIAVIIPHFNAIHRYFYWGDGGVVGGGPPFSVTGLARQSFHGWPEKLQTVVLLTLPTAFIALGSPVALVALPSLALRFVSTNDSYWGTLFHYNATIMPVLFIAAVDAMARWRAEPPPDRLTVDPAAEPRAGPGAGLVRAARGWSGPPRHWYRSIRARWHVTRAAAARHGAPMMLAVAAALAFQFPLNGLWHGSTYQISPHVAAADAAMAQVPDGATVQTTLNLLAPLAARTDTFWIGNAGNPATQYIVFDNSASGYSPPPKNVPAFITQLHPRDGYVLIFQRDQVYVFRRG
jgi:uncharacterized membrane protein